MTATSQEERDALQRVVDAESKVVDAMYYSGDESEAAIDAYNEAAQNLNVLIERLEQMDELLLKGAK